MRILNLLTIKHIQTPPACKRDLSAILIASGRKILVPAVGTVLLISLITLLASFSTKAEPSLANEKNQEEPNMTHSSDPLDPVSIEYKIRISKFGNAVLGKVQSRLDVTDSGYSIESVTKAQGMALLLMQSNIQESCEFEIVDGRAVARNYNGGTVEKTEYSVGYDWQQRKVSLNDSESLDMPQGYVVDNCIMWFATALLRGELPEEERLYIVDGKSKRIRGYRLRSQSEEVIDTSLGQRETIKMVLERELRPDRTLTFWLSKNDQFLPVRIEESRKSRTTTFEISDLSKAS